MTNLDNYGPLMIELAEITEEMKRLDARKKQLQEEIKPALADRGVFAHGGYTFECTTVAGRTSYDTKAMIADMGEAALDPYRKQGAPSSRIVIKAVNTV